MPFRKKDLYLISIPETAKDKIRKLQEPSTVKELQKVLGFLNFFRLFDPEMSANAAELLKCVKGKYLKKLGDFTVYFEKLKTTTLEGMILAAPTYAKGNYFVVQTDASKNALGGLLMEFDAMKKETKTIDVAHRKLLDAETRYPIRDLEMLALVYSLSKFRSWILGSPIVVKTDHQSLSFILKDNREPELDRMIRYLEKLSDYDLRIDYIKGSENDVADVLSRQLQTIELTHEVDMERLKEEQSKEYTVIIENLTASNEIMKETSSFKLIDGLLWHVSPINDRLVLTESIAKEVAQRVHNSFHFGIVKTFHEVQERYFIKNLMLLVLKTVRCCDRCQRQKHLARSLEDPLLFLVAPKTTFDHIGMDMITGLPTSHECNAILTVVDCLSRYIIPIPCSKKVTTRHVANLLVKHVFTQYGIPSKIVSDRDIRWNNSIFNTIKKMYGFKLSLSSSNHPATNGLTEAGNKKVIAVLKTFCHQNGVKWAPYLPIAQYAINTSYHSVIKMSPFEALLGKRPVKLFATNPLELEDSLFSVEEWGEKIRMIQDQVKATLDIHHEQMNHRFREKPDAQFQRGDFVLVHRDAYMSTKAYRKLMDIYHGPFKVVEVLNPSAYVIDLPLMSKKERTINIQWLRPYLMDEKVFKDIPTTIEQLAARVDEISAIVGYDAENKTFDLTLAHTRPGQTFEIAVDDITRIVPRALQDTLYKNVSAFLGNRYTGLDKIQPDEREDVVR